jgi:hypothetical protein
MVVVSLILAGHCVKTASAANWSCAFGDDSAACLQPDKKPPKQCAAKPPNRPSGFKTWINEMFGGDEKDAPTPCKR